MKILLKNYQFKKKGKNDQSENLEQILGTIP
jgi:hypothetical protein